MAAFSKICVLSLAGQAVVALPRPVTPQSSDIIAKADDEIKWYSDAKLDNKVEWSIGETADEYKESSGLAIEEYLEDQGVDPTQLMSMISQLNPDTKHIVADMKEVIEEQVASAVSGKATEGTPTISKTVLQNDTNATNDTRPGLVATFMQPSHIKGANLTASSWNSTTNSKRDFGEAWRSPEDLGDEIVAFTSGYTRAQSTSYNVEPTAAVVEEVAKVEEAVVEPTAVVSKEAAKIKEAVVVPTTTAVNGTLPTEAPVVEEQADFGAGPLKKQEKKKDKVTESSTEEEEQQPKDKKWKYGAFKKRDNPTNEEEQEPKDKKWKYGAFKRDNFADEVEQKPTDDDKKDKKWKYGAFKKRGEYDQQWADYYNKAGAYEGQDYDVYEYLKEYDAAREPQPEAQPEPVVEEKPIIIPAPQEPAPQPKPVPQPQQDAPIIIPAPQPPQEEPKEDQPAPVQPGQPGEEQLQDFVMFVPKDQSGGAKPYMVPANEYNPDTPPERLPPGVKPPPINLGNQPAQQGENQETIDVPLPDAPEGVEYEYVPVGPSGGPLSDGSHPLPEWFPTRPGPANVQKRGELEERSCGGHPYGREWECIPEHGCSGCYNDHTLDGKPSLSVVAKRGLKNKLSKPFKPKAPKVSAPKLDYDNEADVFNPHVPPPPPYQALPPPPPAPKPPKLPKSKPVDFDIDFDGDDEDFDNDDYQGSPAPAAQEPIEGLPQSAFVDFSGSDKLAELLSCELFRNRCLNADVPKEDYPDCFQHTNPCQDFPFLTPLSESRVDTKPRPWTPAVGAYDKYNYQPPEHDFVKPFADYPQVELQPEYTDFQGEDAGYYVPDCHTCGPCDGSYSEYPDSSNTCPENTCPSPCVAYESRPPPSPSFQRWPELEHPEQSEPELYEYQQPDSDCERSEPVYYYPQLEKGGYGCEQPDYSPPHYRPGPEPCYDCQYQPEPQGPEQPCGTCSHDLESTPRPSYACHECEEPTTAPAPEPVYQPWSQSSEQPCYASEETPEPQPEQSEPASEPQHQEPCYDCAQPAEPKPPQAQSEEPCHTCEQGPESCSPGAPCSGPNFEHPTPDQYPHDGSYPIEEGAGPGPAPGPEAYQTEDVYVHPDGSYSEYAIDHPEYCPECESQEHATETTYPWHFPAEMFEEQRTDDPSSEHQPSPEPDCLECQQGPAPENKPEHGCQECQQVPTAEYRPSPEPECHECQQGPSQEHQPAPEPECHDCQRPPEQYATDPEQAPQFPEEYVTEKSKPAPRPEGFATQQSPGQY